MKKFFKDENGQGMVEYGLIIALIAVVVIVALTAVGGKVEGIFNKISTGLDGAGTGNGGTGNGGTGNGGTGNGG